MKVLLVLCFVAAVAQANDIDWSKVYTMDVYPDNMAEIIAQFEAESEGAQELPSRIVGGQEARLGQFPYQVGLLSATPQGTGFCGGSILNENWILTAAHCVDVASSVRILFAAQNVVNANPEQFSLYAKRIVVHESWNPSIVKDDIALLELPRAITYSELVQPIRLPRRSQVNTAFSDFTGTVSGWGRASDSTNSVSPVLRWTTNPILTNFRCNIRWIGMIDNKQVCLSGENGRSSCNGDSGGALVVTDSDGEVTQVGIVSFGLALGCSRGWPSVYVRVSSYLDWIHTHTRGSVQIRA